MSESSLPSTHYSSLITHHFPPLSSTASVLFRAVDGEIAVGVDARLVELDHAGALGLGQIAALDALRDEAAEALVQLPALVARAVERLADGRALDDLLDQVAVLVNVYVGLVRSAEGVVVVAHRLLVRADEHEGDVVRLALDQRVKLQNLLHVVQA